jgi:hypothetical protein
MIQNTHGVFKVRKHSRDGFSLEKLTEIVKADNLHEMLLCLEREPELVHLQVI